MKKAGIIGGSGYTGGGGGGGSAGGSGGGGFGDFEGTCFTREAGKVLGSPPPP